MRVLTISYNGHTVGDLDENNGDWQLRYAPTWLAREDGFDLSPALPRRQDTHTDNSSNRYVRWFFDNLLPEYEARTLLARDAHVGVADAFGLLEYYGAESAGALTLLPAGVQCAPGSAEPLSDAMLSRRIRNLPSTSLSANAPKRMSLAGAQHKLAVLLLEDQLYEPTGERPSSHILKPDHPHPEHYPHSVANEWFVMTLARRAGLPVPSVQMRRVPEPIYLIERFDRQAYNGQLQRLHVLDGCQLLGLDAQFKYQHSTMATLQTLLGYCRARAQTRQTFYRWLLFNLLLGNDDAHLKNLSFHVTATGIDLAPHYDLLCTIVYADHSDWLSRELTWPAANMRRYGDVTRERVIEAGHELGLPSRLGERLLDQTLRNVQSAAQALIDEMGDGVNAGEQRLIRQIHYGVLRDMAARMA